jgi:hypothetical protein
MSDWSLGAVNARKMKIVALREEESCGSYSPSISTR